jgi:hypothetical protein
VTNSLPDEIQVKLSDLRGAAEQMRFSCLRIDESAQTVKGIIAGLYDAGYDGGAGTFALLYAQTYGDMDDRLRDLSEFAGKLSGAADDVERAITPRFATLDALYKASGRNLTDLNAISSAIAPPTPPMPVQPEILDNANVYLNAANRPLFNQLLLDKTALTNAQTEVNTLTAQRATVQADLTALKNRLLSYDPNTNMSNVPRVVALEEQIKLLDGQITAAQTRVETMGGYADALTTRLNRVMPGMNADISLIQGMETAQTAPWVKANTQDCVNYIVGKLPVPDGMAGNAYLWNDRAAALPQYGITTGNVPLAGSVLVMEQAHPYADPVFGHLMYVERADATGIWITDNLHAEPVNLADLTPDINSPNLSYLYFPWHTHA